MNTTELVEVLKRGGVVVMPTDTIYGIVGKAENAGTVERIYKIRKRPPEKPCIILISDVSDLEKFLINLSATQRKVLEEYWGVDSSEPTSIVLDIPKKFPDHLDRGVGSVPFRLPKPAWLRDLLKVTGPLIAPSANPHGLPPAVDIDEAKKYFGEKVDFYLDGGSIDRKPSKIIRLHLDAAIEILRP